jgi:(p)ppGpp synthase/HD superfamily hydrolase
MYDDLDHPTIRRAQRIAMLAHQGQVDKAGNPYIGHPARVAQSVYIDPTMRERFAYNLREAVAAAWLHDVVEDTIVTFSDLSLFGVSPFVLHYVEDLTKKLGESRDDYYARIKESGPIPLAIKAADIADNMDPSRMRLLPLETQVRLLRKYAYARAALGINS